MEAQLWKPVNETFTGNWLSYLSIGWRIQRVNLKSHMRPVHLEHHPTKHIQQYQKYSNIKSITINATKYCFSAMKTKFWLCIACILFWSCFQGCGASPQKLKLEEVAFERATWLLCHGVNTSDVEESSMCSTSNLGLNRSLPNTSSYIGSCIHSFINQI